MREKGQKVKVEMKDDDTFMQIGGRCFHACVFIFPFLFCSLRWHRLFPWQEAWPTTPELHPPTHTEQHNEYTLCMGHVQCGELRMLS